jgi:hypothetical protein
MKARASGPRCPSCNRYFEPRTLRDGSMSKTCGQTACVSAYQTRKGFNLDNNQPRQPRKATSLY